MPNLFSILCSSALFLSDSNKDLSIQQWTNDELMTRQLERVGWCSCTVTSPSHKYHTDLRRRLVGWVPNSTAESSSFHRQDSFMDT
jgi:hypothetical protein